MDQGLQCPYNMMTFKHSREEAKDKPYKHKGALPDSWFCKHGVLLMKGAEACCCELVRGRGVGGRGQEYLGQEGMHHVGSQKPLRISLEINYWRGQG